MVVLNQLSLNYLSLLNIDQEDAPVTLKELLMVFVSSENDLLKKQIESITRVETSTVNKVVRHYGVAAPVRGIKITVTLDEAPIGRYPSLPVRLGSEPLLPTFGVD